MLPSVTYSRTSGGPPTAEAEASGAGLVADPHGVAVVAFVSGRVLFGAVARCSDALGAGEARGLSWQLHPDSEYKRTVTIG